MMFYCPSFPSPHLRTNAIMADRDSCWRPPPDRAARKAQAYRLESELSWAISAGGCRRSACAPW